MPYKDPEARREYRRAWREVNREKIREWNRVYRDANREKRRESDRVYRDANREKRRKLALAYYSENREEHLRRWRAYYDANRDKYLESRRAYNDQHREYRNALTARWSADLARKIPSTHTGTPWTPAEDAIVIRTDITVIEMAYMLQRSYTSVTSRRKRLRKVVSQ